MFQYDRNPLSPAKDRFADPAGRRVSASDGARGNGSPPERACSAKPVATIITLSNSKPAGKIVSRNH